MNAMNLYRRELEIEMENDAIEEKEYEDEMWARNYFGHDDDPDDELWDYLHELEERIANGESELWDEYSDVYKDLHGVRPRWC